MKKILIAVMLVGLLLLMTPTAVSAAGITIVGKTGDGEWKGNIWEISLYPGEGKSTTLTLRNSSSNSLEVWITLIPDSFDSDVTFKSSEANFIMSAGGNADVILTATASGSAAPGIYIAELVIRSELPPVPTPSPAIGGGGGSPYFLSNTDCCGVLGKFWIDYRGRVLYTFSIGCVDGPLTITVNQGTIALGEDGKPLKLLSMYEDLNPPELPEDAHIIGLAYDFSPDGATFNSPLTLTWSYDALPEGVAEEDLVVAYYDETTGEWVELDSVVDTENNTIIASVFHFTTFAVLAPIPEIEEVIEEPEVVEPEEEEPVDEEPVVEEEEEEEPEEVIDEEAEEQEPAAQFPWWIVVATTILLLTVVGGIAYWLYRKQNPRTQQTTTEATKKR